MRVLRICDTFAAGSNRDKDAKSVNHYILPRGGMGQKKEYNEMISKIQKDVSDLDLVMQTSRN